MIGLLHSLCPTLNEAQLIRFDTYFRLLVEWNEKMNLTAITEKSDVAKKHFADSLAALPLIGDGAAVIDVGTGAGFPGVPLLIANPTLRLTLLDSLNKRLTFLEALLGELGLNANLVHARAEDGGRDAGLRGRFDVAVTRAVAPLPVLVELTVPFVRVGGKSIAYKGDATEELPLAKSALHLLNASAKVQPIASEIGARSLVIITKEAPTPKTYPRKPGTPSRRPL